MMYRLIKKIFLASLATLFLNACGSDSGTGSDDERKEEAKTVQKSSDSRKSSSSVYRQESSSSVFSLPVKIANGVMVDSRDGKEYLTVTIGEQTWMAEELNFDYEVDGESYGSVYVASAHKVDNYSTEYPGRRYTMAAAFDSAAIFSIDGQGCGSESKCFTKCDTEGICSLGEKVRGICPEGWHLPSNADWVTLIDAAGGDSIARWTLMSEPWSGGNSKGSRPTEEMIDASNFHAHWKDSYYDGKYAAGTTYWSATGVSSEFWIAMGAPPGGYDDGYFVFEISEYEEGRRIALYVASLAYSFIRCIKD